MHAETFHDGGSRVHICRGSGGRFALFYFIWEMENPSIDVSPLSLRGGGPQRGEFEPIHLLREKCVVFEGENGQLEKRLKLALGKALETKPPGVGKAMSTLTTGDPHYPWPMRLTLQHKGRGWLAINKQFLGFDKEETPVERIEVDALGSVDDCLAWALPLLLAPAPTLAHAEA